MWLATGGVMVGRRGGGSSRQSTSGTDMYEHDHLGDDDFYHEREKNVCDKDNITRAQTGVIFEQF